jgi:hypothetical protein
MTKPFWDVEETVGFVNIKSKIDSLFYKVYNVGSTGEMIQVADSLALVRRDLNKLLFYLCRNPNEWINKNIALGIFLTFEIHIPCIFNSNILDIIINSDDSNDDYLSNQINMECQSINKLFSIQEMTPNEYGILGLNKPKGTKLINLDDNTTYEVASKRSFHLTIRPIKMNNGNIINVGPINNYNNIILPLALHEITHTTCNDNKWKEDNHMYPFNNYHSFLKKCFNKIK